MLKKPKEKWFVSLGIRTIFLSANSNIVDNIERLNGYKSEKSRFNR